MCSASKKWLGVVLALALIAQCFGVMAAGQEEPPAEDPPQGDWIAGEFPTGDYTIVVIPDTQNMPENAPQKMTDMTNWIKDNKTAMNIRFAIGVGDIINKNENSQWAIARDAYNVLLGEVPFVPVVGNHDVLVGNNRSSHEFNTYFPYATYAAIPGFGGSYPAGKMDNSYYFFTVGDVKYLVLGLNYCPDDKELTWADAVVAANPECTVIVSVHNYLGRDGELTSRKPGDDVFYFEGANTGDMVWEKFVKKHSNISLVVSGHVSNPDLVVKTDTGVNGNTVQQVMCDNNGISMAEGGLGMLMLLTVRNNSDTVDFSWYSVDRDEFYKPINQFQLEVTKHHIIEEPPLFDDFSGGLDAKLHSRSENLKTENSKPSGTSVQKNRVLRNDENGAEIVYQTEKDIINFEIVAYLESRNQKKGILTFYGSDDGENYTLLANDENFAHTGTGSGKWAESVSKSSGGIPPGTRYFKVVFSDNTTAGQTYNPLLDSVKLTLASSDSADKTALVPLVAEALGYSQQRYDSADLYGGFADAFTAVKATLADTEATNQEVYGVYQQLRDAIDAVEAFRLEQELLFDDFSGGLDAKLHSRSENLKTENSQQKGTPSQKLRVLRNSADSAEIVYKTEADFAEFEVVSYLDSWKQSKGMLTFYVSVDGVTYTPLSNVDEIIAPTVRGSGAFAHSVARSVGVPRGMKYLKIVFADTETSLYNWSPILDSVRMFAALPGAVSEFAVRNSNHEDANGVLTEGKHYLTVNLANTGIDKTYFCAIALYDAGRLVSVKTKQITLTNGNGGAVDASDDISVEVAGIAGKKVAAFLWDGGTLTPEAAAIVVTP
ncbi:MAG: metallophosphoesterase [Clostridiales bacterium]|jgi:hypothetical protein|nr:metallophosphoesterase [Clostridiales bacterium]